AVDDKAAMRRLGGEIAVAPDAGETREIGVVILAAVGIVPEANGHAGKRAAADELALVVDRCRLAVVGENVDGPAETRRLDLAAPNRADGIAENEARDDVGAAGDRGRAEIGLHLVVDEIEALGRKW